MKTHIVCLGDSNTHGYCADPGDCADQALQRFNEAERWTCLLQAALGESYLVLEEGLSGRTTVFDDPLHEDLSAIEYLAPCLKSHEPVSLLVIMLGTNDTKERFAASASCIALGMERLVGRAKLVDCWVNKQPNILIVAPPAILPEMESSAVYDTMGSGCVAKSRILPQRLETSAALLGVHFMDAGDCEFNTLDGMHLTKAGHRQLAKKLTDKIADILSNQGFLPD